MVEVVYNRNGAYALCKALGMYNVALAKNGTVPLPRSSRSKRQGFVHTWQAGIMDYGQDICFTPIL